MKKYLWQIRCWIFLQLLFNLLYAIFVAFIPYILKYALDYDYRTGSLLTVLCFIGIYLLTAVLSMAFQYCLQLAAWKMDQQFYLQIKDDLFRSILLRRPEDFRKKGISEYVSILNNDVPVLEEYILNWIVVVQDITQILVYAVYLMLLNWKVALVIIFTSLLSLLLPNLTGKTLSSRRENLQKHVGDYISQTTDLLSAMVNVNAQTLDNIQSEQRHSLNTMENARLHYGKYRAFSIVLNGFCMYLLDISAFAAVILSLLFRTITLGTATALLSYIKEFTYPVRSLISAISGIKSTRDIQKGIFSLLSYQPVPLEIPASFKEEIAIQNITISWEQFHMENFAYTFKKGKKYAVIGHSGSGKSTLLRLISGQDSPDSGKILMDGKDLSLLDVSSRMAYITQNEHVYHTSFEKNATVFHSYTARSLPEILRFMESTRARLLASKKDCSDFSGGEKNILAIVKLLLMEKEILLMDEPFSALDLQSKRLLQKKLLELPEKTLIMVTHDISKDSLQYFDEILILKDGFLSEAGTPEHIFTSRTYLELLENA